MSHEHDSSYKYLFSAPEMVRDLILRTLTGLTPLLDPLLIVMQAWADYLDRLKNGEK